MKAREIKKRLEENYDNHIKSYKETMVERLTDIRIMKAKIRQLEIIMFDLFGVTYNYIFDDDKKESEADDVPF
jgi:hypothetical protein